MDENHRLLVSIDVGGSFGVVYKGIEKATGEVVAIKHVSHLSTAPAKAMPSATVRN